MVHRLRPIINNQKNGAMAVRDIPNLPSTHETSQLLLKGTDL